VGHRGGTRRTHHIVEEKPSFYWKKKIAPRRIFAESKGCHMRSPPRGTDASGHPGECENIKEDIMQFMDRTEETLLCRTKVGVENRFLGRKGY